MDGFVDYGDVTSTATEKLADHGLVLMFVPLFEEWVQPIASFATKGAAPGKILKDFLEMLNTTERNAVKENLKLFASQQTTESLRVTLLSTIDVIAFLLAQGANYVPTAKLNQDPLERHFGLARSFGGDESHPTVVNFSQIFRLLSLYTPIKTALRGSVQGTPCSVLVSVTDTLKITKDAHQEEKVRLHDIVEAKMMEITTASADTSEQGPSDHAYFKGEVEDSVVYYLCGYVIHKFTKHATCHLCIEDISSATPALASDSYLTDYRSFKQGRLKHPTQKMLTFFKIVSKVVSACLELLISAGTYFGKCWKSWRSTSFLDSAVTSTIQHSRANC
ncbi:hypothetical protein HPB51_003717 [Rhipicephalus microplus]|uniref:Transposable element n=1 Tax=Rhipicephalus microplus TaxID=6941 RepID=A0A9J6E6R7_RHIMP|nr:hypothetical protein HPB51_003717 [Rhipicephalus microplus]